MFSKPTITTRNDNITRKDVKSVLGSGSGLAGAVPEPKLVSEPPGATPEEKPTTVSDTDTPSAARLTVGPDVKLKGAEILDCDTLVVEGRVEATMDSRVIRIADKGAFCGKVSIDVAEIHGTFETAGRLAIKNAADELGLRYLKEWVSALDDRVRDDHGPDTGAHGQTVAIDEEFEVGGARGMNPGEMGDPSQDINCRCTSKYIVDRS